MKVKLLKKLRKKAYGTIGMLYFKDSVGRDVYNIGVRWKLTPDYSCDAKRVYDIESAKTTLAWYRREMILYWISQKVAKKEQKKLDEINKELFLL